MLYFKKYQGDTKIATRVALPEIPRATSDEMMNAAVYPDDWFGLGSDARNSCLTHHHANKPSPKSLTEQTSSYGTGVELFISCTNMLGERHRTFIG